MTERFRDHFSQVAAEYARFRPRYPRELFAFLGEAAPSRRLAWDAGTGNGQAAVALAEEFERVVATDASAAQLTHAEPHPRVEYRVGEAEASELPDASADLAAAAQAAHWFDLPAYFREVTRVLAPRGIVALFGYGDPAIPESPVLDALLQRFNLEALVGYWPPERRLVDARYAPIVLPFPELESPGLEIRARLTLAQLMGHLRTWSGVRAYIARHGEDPVTPLEREMGGVWGVALQAHLVRWPVFVRAGRKPA